MIRVDVTNETPDQSLDTQRLVRGVQHGFDRHPVAQAQIGIAIVGDKTIHDLNRRYLDHDYPTDVLSFPLADNTEGLEGEIVVSRDTAATQAVQFGWSIDDELLLYVIHGALHLAGFDDKDEKNARKMRAAQREILSHFGIEPRDEVPSEDDCRALHRTKVSGGDY